ncbi:hypothetical protein CRM22_004871 [Opisthorchis felineus]|uniref:Uncharacterized protein n=1 Tax=Opisthorchis felineus TaxID=147828 RepID=A0A4S2LU28_OPIFE|nr:hypothetical protein CRM22_004871 [Opisthorchis felineus]
MAEHKRRLRFSAEPQNLTNCTAEHSEDEIQYEDRTNEERDERSQSTTQSERCANSLSLDMANAGIIPLFVIHTVKYALNFLLRPLMKATKPWRRRMRRRRARLWCSIQETVYSVYCYLELAMRRRVVLPVCMYLINKCYRHYISKMIDGGNQFMFLKHTRYTKIIGRVLVWYLRALYSCVGIINSKMQLDQISEVIQGVRHGVVSSLRCTWEVIINLCDITSVVVNIISVCCSVLTAVTDVFYFLARLISVSEKLLHSVDEAMCMVQNIIGKSDEDSSKQKEN